MRGWEAVGRLGLVAVMVLGACSIGGDDDAGRARGSSPDGGSEQDDAEQDGTGQDLRPALLTLVDMPDGWDDVHVRHSAVEPCSTASARTLGQGRSQPPAFTAAFVSPDRAFTAQVDAFQLLVPAPAGRGDDLLGQVQWQLDNTCGTGAEVDGYAYPSSEELPLPVFGDQSVARRVTVEELATGRSQGYNMVYGRHGDLVVGVGVIEPPGETRHIEQLTALAFERASDLG